MKFLEISEESIIFSKFTEFSVLLAIHPPETLIFLRNHWCFRDASIFAKFFIFTKNAKIREKIIIHAFLIFCSKNHNLRKIGPRAPEITKDVWNSIGFNSPGASGSRGTKKRAKLRKSREIFRVFRENADFYVKSWEFTKNIILRSPKTLVFLVKYHGLGIKSKNPKLFPATGTKNSDIWGK